MPLQSAQALPHAARGWYLRWSYSPTETYPDGNHRRELLAVRDDGPTVTMTTQPDLEPVFSDDPKWLPDGQRVSWLARRWLSGVVVEGGLYVATLAFDGAGDVVGLVAQPSSPYESRPLSSGQPDIAGFTWAPDSTRFAYTTRYPGGNVTSSLVVVDANRTERTLASQLALAQPSWSPDGTRILYYEDRSRGYHTITPEGTNDLKVIKATSSTYVNAATWSPTSSHIAFSQGSNFLPMPSSLYRVAATGGTPTNLTPQFTHAAPVAWNP
jgi:Tol biopolymer transport system component